MKAASVIGSILVYLVCMPLSLWITHSLLVSSNATAAQFGAFFTYAVLSYVGTVFVGIGAASNRE